MHDIDSIIITFAIREIDDADGSHFFIFCMKHFCDELHAQDCSVEQSEVLKCSRKITPAPRHKDRSTHVYNTVHRERYRHLLHIITHLESSFLPEFRGASLRSPLVPYSRRC